MKAQNDKLQFFFFLGKQKKSLNWNKQKGLEQYK